MRIVCALDRFVTLVRRTVPSRGREVLKSSPALARVVTLLNGCCSSLLAQGAMQWRAPATADKLTSRTRARFFPFLLLSTLNAFFDAVQAARETLHRREFPKPLD